MQRSMTGTLLAFASMAALTAAMLPFRSDLSLALPALILVIPVIIGTIADGFVAGAISVVAGFLTFDLVFLPPYLVVTAVAPEFWAALGVYVLVMLAVSSVVDRMHSARAREQRRSDEIRDLFELSDLLVEYRPLDQLLPDLVISLAAAFDARQVAVFLPGPSGLQMAADTGPPFDRAVYDDVATRWEQVSDGGPHGNQGDDDPLVLALVATGRPMGMLALSAKPEAVQDREPLLIFANQIALAVERDQLRDQALQVRLTEEVARLAKVLVAAVSHDLRAPLACIKASSSVLCDPELDLEEPDRLHLATLIDDQADLLAYLVQNLLDMSRVQAGVLKPRIAVTPLGLLVTTAVGDLAPALAEHTVVIDVPDDLPQVSVDPVLIGRCIANLLTNAGRHGPKGTDITVSAHLLDPGRVQLSVTDCGPGVRPSQHGSILDMLSVRRDDDAGTGLGLTIARTFVEAHGEHIWVEDSPRGGARFNLTLPVADAVHGTDEEEPIVGEHSHHR